MRIMAAYEVEPGDVPFKSRPWVKGDESVTRQYWLYQYGMKGSDPTQPNFHLSAFPIAESAGLKKFSLLTTFVVGIPLPKDYNPLFETVHTAQAELREHYLASEATAQALKLKISKLEALTYEEPQ